MSCQGLWCVGDLVTKAIRCGYCSRRAIRPRRVPPCGFLEQLLGSQMQVFFNYNPDLPRIIVSFSPIFIKITLKWGVHYHQLPAKYPQLPALLIGPIETLMWRIETTDNISRTSPYTACHSHVVLGSLMGGPQCYMSIFKKNGNVTCLSRLFS